MDFMPHDSKATGSRSLFVPAETSKVKVLGFGFIYLMALYGAYQVVASIYQQDIILRAPKAVHVQAASPQPAYLQPTLQERFAPILPAFHMHAGLSERVSPADCNAAISSLSRQLLQSTGKAYARITAHALIADLFKSVKEGDVKAYYTAAGLTRKFEQPTYISAEVLMGHVFQVSHLDTMLWDFDDLRFLPQFRSHYRVGVVVSDMAAVDTRKMKLVAQLAKSKSIPLYILVADQAASQQSFNTLQNLIGQFGQVVSADRLSQTCGQMI